MTSLFGVPIDQWLAVMLGIFLLGLLVLVVMAVRNRMAVRLAVRNIPRRRTQTGLIVLGLMLATLLFSAAFATGDTLTNSIRRAAIADLGQTDVAVRSKALDSAGGYSYFAEDVVARVRRAAGGSPDVEVVVGAVREQVAVLAPASGQSEPQVSLMGLPAGGGQIGVLQTDTGEALDVAGLTTGQAYLSARTADALDVGVDDQVQVFAGPQPVAFTVAGVYERGEHPAGPLSLVVPLTTAQQLLDIPAQVNEVLISNRGDAIAGAQHSDAVVALVTPAVAGTGLEVSPVKADALKDADDTGTSLSTAFLLMAQFSVAAGVLLIFLIFVMLAAERKHELGVARAVGAQRGHVIRMFTFEGALYAVMAAALGSLLGVGVGYAMVFVLRAAFAPSAEAAGSLELAFAFNGKSVVLAYTMGVVLTLLVVVFSSWRVSRLNIVRAVRGIPEPRVPHRGWFRTVLLVLVPIAGLLLAAAGLQGNQLGPFMLGTSLVIVGLALLARRFGLPDRVAFTVAGAGLLVWWLLPSLYPSFYEDWLPEMTQGMEMFFLSGIMLVIGAVWVVVYNSDLLLAAVVAVFGRIPGAPPVLKTAVSYPMASRFRTGMTLAMFSLVVFTLVVMSFIITGNRQVLSDEEALSGGYQVRAQTSALNPIGDLPAQLTSPAAAPAAVSPDDIVAVGALSAAPVEGGPAGSQAPPGEFLLQGADPAYTESTGYGFVLRAEQYGSDRQVWRALQDQPDTAVVSAATVPSQSNYSLNAPDPPFMFSGVYLQDTQLPDLRLSVRDPVSGNTRNLKVIGVLDPLSVYTGTAMVSQQTIDDVVGRPVAATSHWLTIAEGRDPELVAQALERQFLANGLQAVDTAGEIRRFSATNLMVNNLLQGFMALGLVVGVSALGVIAARSVVERRQQIGVLRAIGFQKGMVRNSFLLESSFIAILGIGTGLALGLALTPQIMDTMAEVYSGESSVRTAVPWQSLLIVAAVAYAAALLTTILPARQASAVTPAEALRYE